MSTRRSSGTSRRRSRASSNSNLPASNRVAKSGDRIEIWWADDKRYYRGRLGIQVKAPDQFAVAYDDGEKEVLTLSRERWRFEDDRSRTFFPGKQAAQSPQANPKNSQSESPKLPVTVTLSSPKQSNNTAQIANAKQSRSKPQKKAASSSTKKKPRIVKPASQPTPSASSNPDTSHHITDSPAVNHDDMQLNQAHDFVRILPRSSSLIAQAPLPQPHSTMTVQPTVPTSTQPPLPLPLPPVSSILANHAQTSGGVPRSSRRPSTRLPRNTANESVSAPAEASESVPRDQRSPRASKKRPQGKQKKKAATKQTIFPPATDSLLGSLDNAGKVPPPLHQQHKNNPNMKSNSATATAKRNGKKSRAVEGLMELGDEERQFMTHNRENAMSEPENDNMDIVHVPGRRDESPPSVRGPMPPLAKKKRTNPNSRSNVLDAAEDQGASKRQKSSLEPERPSAPAQSSASLSVQLAHATSNFDMGTMLSKKLRPLERQIHELRENVSSMEEAIHSPGKDFTSLRHFFEEHRNYVNVELQNIRSIVLETQMEMRVRQEDIIRLLGGNPHEDYRSNLATPPSAQLGAPHSLPLPPINMQVANGQAAHGSLRPQARLKPIISTQLQRTSKSPGSGKKSGRAYHGVSTPLPFDSAGSQAHFIPFSQPGPVREDVTQTGHFNGVISPMSAFHVRVSSLVARQTTVWLLETPHELDPRRNISLRDWACCTAVAAFRRVADRLSLFETYPQAFQTLSSSLGNDAVDLGWFSNPNDEGIVHAARRNYCAWDPPPTDVEWNAEVDLLRTIASTFQTVLGRYRVTNETDLAAAVSVSLAGAKLLTESGFEEFSPEVSSGNVAMNAQATPPGHRAMLLTRTGRMMRHR